MKSTEQYFSLVLFTMSLYVFELRKETLFKVTALWKLVKQRLKNSVRLERDLNPKVIGSNPVEARV